MSQENKTIERDEIDLLELFKKAIDLFKRRYKLLLLFVFLGIAEGFFYYTIATPLYKSTLIANSEVLRNEYVTILFNNLNELIKEDNSDQLASYLHISKEEAKSIAKIQATKVELKELKVENSSQTLTNTFQIEVMVEETKYLDSIQKGIIYYIQNNEFVRKKVELQRNLYQTMISKINSEILKLDTTRNDIGKSYKKSIDSKFIVMEPSDINNSIVSLQERKSNFENALSLLNEVLVIQNFIKYNKPASPKLLTTISISIGSMITIGLIVIGILEVWRLIK
ncbi:MAG: hypothetical protein SFY32_04490 [Bacteroidota bacterium]|nr:hypothetical protein [Bacteroidota bacterium]